MPQKNVFIVKFGEGKFELKMRSNGDVQLIRNGHEWEEANEQIENGTTCIYRIITGLATELAKHQTREGTS